MPARRLLVRTTVAALCATGGIAILVLLTRSFDDLSWRILATTTTISLCSLLAVPAGVLLERGTRRLLAHASAALTTAAFVLTLVGLWIEDHGSAFWKTWGIVATLAVAAAQACGMESRRRSTDRPVVRGVVTGNAVAGVVLAALGIAGILQEIDSGRYLRAVGALGILDVLLLVVAAVLRRGTGTADSIHRVRVDGRLVESRGADFAAAAAAAIREAERNGAPVRRIERA
jgi:hypothetical protein